MSAQADLCELDLWQVSKCSARSDGRFVETVYGGSWPIAHIEGHARKRSHGVAVRPAGD